MNEIWGSDYGPASLIDRGLAPPPFNLAMMLEVAARERPDAAWIADRDGELSYGDADRLAGRLAATLIAKGVAPGDRVAILISNHRAFVVAVWGAWRAGAIVSAMHPAYAETTLATQIDDCAPSALVTLDEPALHERAARLTGEHGIALIALHASGPIGNDVLVDEPAPARLAAIDDLALLQYTGGTTGGVKAAMLSHRNISENLGQLNQLMSKLQPGAETILAVAPFAHITGFSLLCQATHLGARVVLENRFEADRTAQLCFDERISFFSGVPTLMEALNRSPVAQAGNWRALKYVISGGAPLPSSTRARFEAMTGCRLLCGYGLSESAPAVLLGYGDTGAPPECVGPPIPGTRIAISAVDDPGRFLPLGESGEIRVGGPQIMQGYWQKPEESAAVLAGGLLRTGDVGHIDSKGRVHVSSRLKELIIASGYNVYPSRVEDAILTHEAIADAAVIGVPDDYRGETVKAVVALKPGYSLELNELQAWLKPRLSPMEMPKLLELRDSLPKSPAGKTLKIALKEIAEAV